MRTFHRVDARRVTLVSPPQAKERLPVGESIAVIGWLVPALLERGHLVRYGAEHSLLISFPLSAPFRRPGTLNPLDDASSAVPNAARGMLISS
jgi:hypothetical protein